MKDMDFLVSGYLRSAALSVAVYEYTSTLPLVLRIYKEHWTERRVTIPVVLLFLLRLTTMVAILSGSFAFFHHDFSQILCSRIHMLAPTFRAMQTTVSQAILGHRAIYISKRSTYVTYTLIAVYLVVCPLQWVTTLYGRKALLGTYGANCRAAVVSPFVGVWMNYALAIGYDLLATGICLRFLLRWKKENPIMSNFFAIAICHGLGYFLLLTGTNILNTVIFSHNSEYETAGAPLGTCVTMIICQKLLTHVYTCRSGYLNGCKAETALFSRDVLTSQFGGSRASNTDSISRDMI